MAWHSEVLNVILNALKPTVEGYMEDVIALVLRYEPLREFVAKNPDAFAAGLSAAIGSIPEMDKRTVLGRIEGYIKDVLESFPREVSRAAKGEGTTQKGVKVEEGTLKAGKGRKVTQGGAFNRFPTPRQRGGGRNSYLASLPRKRS